MPVRAPVKQVFNLLEAMTSKRQVLLGRFAGREDHAPVRVGSAAMPAPFAFCAASAFQFSPLCPFIAPPSCDGQIELRAKPCLIGFPTHPKAPRLA